MRDFTDDLAELRRRIGDAKDYLRVGAARRRLVELEEEMSRPDLWDDATLARKVGSELAEIRDDIALIERLDGQIEDLETLYELGRSESDDSVVDEIDRGIDDLQSELHRLELRALFIGEHDERDAICSVNSGAGGTDAQDWAEMLLRMYTRWAERRGFEVRLDAIQPGTEAGISSATFTVTGRHAYGLLTGEKGVHRLVRLSPFDSQHRRQTAFASFEAVPALEEAEQPDIDPSDLRVDTFRSSGAGGQHVNVTDSAIRITHLPTGTVVSCQNERSQTQNKARAMQILAARLAEAQREEHKAELERIAGEKRDVAWGSQIRSYVLAPYQLAKDERTRQVDGRDQPIHETANVAAVLDGDLDAFVEAFLQWRRHKSGGVA